MRVLRIVLFALFTIIAITSVHSKIKEANRREVASLPEINQDNTSSSIDALRSSINFIKTTISNLDIMELVHIDTTIEEAKKYFIKLNEVAQNNLTEKQREELSILDKNLSASARKRNNILKDNDLVAKENKIKNLEQKLCKQKSLYQKLEEKVNSLIEGQQSIIDSLTTEMIPTIQLSIPEMNHRKTFDMLRDVYESSSYFNMRSRNTTFNFNNSNIMKEQASSTSTEEGPLQYNFETTEEKPFEYVLSEEADNFPSFTRNEVDLSSSIQLFTINN